MVDLLLDDEENYAIKYPTMLGTITEYITGPEYAQRLLDNNDYYIYRQNTLGYITRSIRVASDGKFVGIKPYCDDGRPIYSFTENTQFMPDLPLFEPLVVSQDAYDRLKAQGKVDGYLMVDLKVNGAPWTEGILPNEMNKVEWANYGAKIPLADQFGGFEYPIKNVTLYAMVDGVPIASKDLTPDQYAIDGLGNLYFYESVD